MNATRVGILIADGYVIGIVVPKVVCPIALHVCWAGVDIQQHAYVELTLKQKANPHIGNGAYVFG